MTTLYSIRFRGTLKIISSCVFWFTSILTSSPLDSNRFMILTAAGESEISCFVLFTSYSSRVKPRCALWVQRSDLNRQSSGYEPNEIPFLHSAICARGCQSRAIKFCGTLFQPHAFQHTCQGQEMREKTQCQVAANNGTDPLPQGSKPCVLPLHQFAKSER